MKRSDLLKYLRSQGCEFIREGSRHSCGGTQVKIKDHLSQGIMKLMIILHKRFVKISE